MARHYVPDRGDLVWLQCNPQAGSEQAGRRPALVISPKAYNGKVGRGLCCPVRSQVKGYPFEVQLPSNIGVAGVILADQLKNLDWRARKTKRLGTVPPRVMRELLGQIRTLVT